MKKENKKLKNNREQKEDDSFFDFIATIGFSIGAIWIIKKIIDKNK
ncbi:MAG: hypothetical protein V1779_08950 [bacterium]